MPGSSLGNNKIIVAIDTYVKSNLNAGPQSSPPTKHQQIITPLPRIVKKHLVRQHKPTAESATLPSCKQRPRRQSLCQHPFPMSGKLSHIWIRRISQTIAQKIEHEYGRNHKQAGYEQPAMVGDLDDLLGVLEQHAPAYRRRLQSEPQKAQ